MEESVYITALKSIPKGQTRSFGEIALMAGKPGAARAAGRVLTSYPPGGKAPWQRAVTAHGGFSIDPERAALQLDRLRRDGARPREGESIFRWARRVRAVCVGNYKTCQFVELTDPRLETFDPLFVEAFDSDITAGERGFVPKDAPTARQLEPAARKRTAGPSRRKVARG
ncbi:MAG: MGMT family protein [Planctomycetes bacterium]|nr:MGMT family protein [Planctomycetota bacterium]